MTRLKGKQAFTIWVSNLTLSHMAELLGNAPRAVVKRVLQPGGFSDGGATRAPKCFICLLQGQALVFTLQTGSSFVNPITMWRL